MTRVCSRASGVIAAALAAMSWLAPSAHADAASPPAEFDLVGVWHVLVHYTDTESSHPEQVRWHDRLWVFEHVREKLVWSEYPIVVFGDESARFESLGTNRAKRVLGGWQPAETQLANIRIGLMTNDRGMRSKKLRGSVVDGWTTTSRARASSTSAVTYQEIWSVAYADGLPTFAQKDVMGSVRAENLNGLTQFTVRGRDADGALVGEYERDGTRFGQFWMRRAGERRRLDRKDPKQRARDTLEAQRAPVEPERRRDGAEAD